MNHVHLLAFLSAGFVGLAAVVNAAVGQGESQPLNVVLLVTDDHRWDAWGAAGNPIIHTPNLDRLAQEGIRFSRAYVTTSICMTSRASMLTGQWMSRHGIDRFGKPLSPEQFAETYAGRLRAAGYYSGFVGKYGIGAARAADFDFVRAYEGRHWLKRDGEPIHVTEQNARDALEFLEQRPRSQPFLLSVSFFAPHAEDGAPEQYLPQPWSAEHYAGIAIPESPLMAAPYHDALPPFLRHEQNEGRLRFHKRFDTPENYQRSVINYYRLITEVDKAIGQIVEALQDQGVYGQTLIVFTSDNGYFLGERGLADKWYPYEESLRVPLLIRDPRIAPDRRGTVVDELVLNVDVAPTILAAAAITPPRAMQGMDLARLYTSDQPIPWRDEFFYEHPTITSRNRIPASQAIVRRDVKYIYWPEWDFEQLFDLSQDPHERHNLAVESDRKELLKQFRQRLEEWQARVR